jgi:polyisoprenoid-binding protein YceI
MMTVRRLLSLASSRLDARSLRLLLPALVLAAAPLHAQPATWQIDPAHTAAQFAVRHMMVSTVRGQFDKLSGTVTWDGKEFAGASVDVTIDANSINTREPKRDDHLRSADFFDVAKYPTLTFKSTKIEPAGNGKLRMLGDLTIHGVTKPVVFDVDGPTPAIKDTGGGLRVGASATTTISRKDFGLLWNRALEAGGMVVSDEVAITIDLEMRGKAAAPASAPAR